MASPQSNLTAPYPPPADPFTQPVTLLLPDGTPFNVTMDQFSWFHTFTTQMAVTGSAGFKRKGDRVKRSLILRSA